MAEQQISDYPHKRLNLLTGEWVLVSPHRAQRPWTGQQEAPDAETAVQYDPGCYLCPGNQRAGGEKNPRYTDTFVFTNDFSALLPDTGTDRGPDAGPETESDRTAPDPLLQSAPESGICRVICYHPRHDLTMARMDRAQIERVIDVWIAEFEHLSREERIAHVQIFENRGELMGCSNPHPHGQIWANSTIPTVPLKEDEHQYQYLTTHGRCLLCDYLERELKDKERVVFSNDTFVCLVPFWAEWPFETMILPRRHMGAIPLMTPDEKKDLAAIIQQLGICYDNLFTTSFPYSMGIHQHPAAETKARAADAWHFHFHYYPPLLRSKTIKKHMVGYEMLAMPQRDITAEKAAAMLRAQPAIHYLENCVRKDRP